MSFPFRSLSPLRLPRQQNCGGEQLARQVPPMVQVLPAPQAVCETFSRQVKGHELRQQEPITQFWRFARFRFWLRQKARLWLLFAVVMTSDVAYAVAGVKSCSAYPSPSPDESQYQGLLPPHPLPLV